MDSQHEQETSTTFMQLVSVLGTEPVCTLTITVLPRHPDSKNQGHKFKVTAVMMNRKTAVSFAWPEVAAVFVAADIFSGEFGKKELEGLGPQT
jgi:hypothetical protein